MIPGELSGPSSESLTRNATVVLIASTFGTIGLNCLTYGNVTILPEDMLVLLGAVIGISAIALGFIFWRRARLAIWLGYPLAIVLAGTMAGLIASPFENYHFVLGVRYGLATSILWVSLDAITRSFLSLRWIASNRGASDRFIVLASLVTVLPFSVWFAAEVPVEIFGPGAVTSSECEMLASALRQRQLGGVENGLAVSSDAKCDWHSLGLSPEPRQNRTYLEGLDVQPAIIVSRARYSLLRTKAVLEVGFVGGILIGQGEECTYRRGLGDWQLQSCRDSWIA